MAAPRIDFTKKERLKPKAFKEINPYEGMPHETDDGEGWLISYADLMTLLVGFFIVLQSFSTIDDQSFEKVKKETTLLFGGEYKVPFEDLKKSIENVLVDPQIKNQVVIEPSEKGLTVTFRGALFFDPGSVELKPQALGLMEKIIPVISSQASDFGIVVEGHTDDVPLNGKGPILSNWELSSLRACRILHLFEVAQFAREKMKALGWGDTRPVVPNKDSSGVDIPANQAQNRRVVIKIIKSVEALNE